MQSLVQIVSQQQLRDPGTLAKLQVVYVELQPLQPGLVEAVGTSRGLAQGKVLNSGKLAWWGGGGLALQHTQEAWKLPSRGQYFPAVFEELEHETKK